MLKQVDIRPEEIALGFLVSSLRMKNKPTTRLALSRFSLSSHLSSALRKGVVFEESDAATGIRQYNVTTSFTEQFCTARAAQLFSHHSKEAAKTVADDTARSARLDEEHKRLTNGYSKTDRHLDG